MYCAVCAGGEFICLRGQPARRGFGWLVAARPAQLSAECFACRTVTVFPAGSVIAAAVSFGSPRYVLKAVPSIDATTALVVASLDHIRANYRISTACAADEEADRIALEHLRIIADGMRSPTGIATEAAS
jgi:hypothetical protein